MKREFVVFLLTFCLTFLLFTIIPINSQSAGEYDPWLDYNDDGQLDMRDIGASARAFGTSGDPTKYVEITYGTYEWSGSKTISADDSWKFSNTTTGYKTVTISIFPRIVLDSTPKNVTIYVGFRRGVHENWVDEFTIVATYYIIMPPNPPGENNHVTKTYSITGSEIWICIYNPNVPNTMTVSASVSFYMTT